MLACILLVSTLAVAATREPPPAAGMYSLSQMQDYLIHIDGNGTNKTIGKVDLGQQFNPIGPQLSTIWEDTATMYVLALNKTDGVETSIVGISLADASITGVFQTPLLQNSVEIGVGMTIDAYGKHGLVISGIDTATQKHTAYIIDPSKGHAVQKLSEGFLTGAEGLLDAPHCFDVVSSTYWLMSPAKNYSVSGLFDLVAIDLTKGTETARRTLPAAQMVHAMEHDPHTGDIVALGLDAATFKPYAFTIETSSFQPTILAGFDAYSVSNGISAWDPLRRTIYGMAFASKTDIYPVLVSYSLTSNATTKTALCQGATHRGCDSPFNIDYFTGALYSFVEG